MILAGDVGGTKARLALYQLEDGKLMRQQMETFVSRDFASLEDIIRTFLCKNSCSPAKACFGVPGPVMKGHAQVTNLPWLLDEARIAAGLSISSFKLLNDLVATAMAIPLLAQDGLVTLHKGEPVDEGATCAVLAPGTGLGMAFLHNDSGRCRALASEGGHVDFAPTTEVEIKLLKYLKAKFGRVSYERVLSGPGLVNIYNFLKESGFAPEPPELEKRLQREDPAAVISTAGEGGQYELCVKALDIFASILGSQAGNIVLATLATGGVYLGGGIPPKICEKLQDGTTVSAYLKKGRLSELVKATPLYVILNDHAALLGAAYFASTL